jgi:membrane protein
VTDPPRRDRRKLGPTPTRSGRIKAEPPVRPQPLTRLSAARQFIGRVWSMLAEDDVMFLASGVSFNLLLAVVPFVLLLISVSTFFLGNTPDEAADTAVAFLDRLLPTTWSEGQSVRATVREIARVSGSVTLYSTIGFLWFSTRVFSSMRSVFQKTFDVPNERGILHGKAFDLVCSLFAAIGITAYGSLSAYLIVATTRGASVLERLGVRNDIMGPLEYAFGRLVAFALVVLLCFAVYRLIPNRPIPSRTAWVGSITTSVLFEIARIGFSMYVAQFALGSFYTGALATLVVITLWTYYASLIFILGAEVAQAVELRHHSRPVAPP